MKQTAIEWLVEQLHSGKELSTVIPQAKAMEKDQIIDAWIVADNPLQRMEAEKYYNITYKQDL